MINIDTAILQGTAYFPLLEIFSFREHESKIQCYLLTADYGVRYVPTK